ncbi:hypothetical protein HYN59_08535 [Flavobacterium album]|uniref:Uncharacterized protein n=1 Tax=Flavobacterium album TaxID=2175091 RepID=A0A2S1QXN6_9FLAO|nr:hypothetical protein [Flavobacterium album]AWH85166.1 hypothetical protein HYN59_08535 [Flavobacterium album]
MEQINDNPQQGNRGGQESGENNLHQSQRNQDSQRHETHPDAEKVEKDSGEKFSPGEDPDYYADEFSTD